MPVFHIVALFSHSFVIHSDSVACRDILFICRFFYIKVYTSFSYFCVQSDVWPSFWRSAWFCSPAYESKSFVKMPCSDSDIFGSFSIGLVLCILQHHFLSHSHTHMNTFSRFICTVFHCFSYALWTNSMEQAIPHPFPFYGTYRLKLKYGKIIDVSHQDSWIVEILKLGTLFNIYIYHALHALFINDEEAWISRTLALLIKRFLQQILK